MSSCNEKEFGPLRELYLAGLLDEEEGSRFELHLMRCEECFRIVQQYNDVSLFLMNSPEVKDEAARLLKSPGDTHPGRRGRSGRFIHAALAVAAVVVILILQPWRLTFEPADEVVAAEDRFALMPLRMSSPTSENGWLADAATRLLLAHLTEARPKQVVSFEQVTEALESLPQDTGYRRIPEAGRRVRARWVCDGRVKNVEPAIEVEVTVIDVMSSDTLSVITQTGDSTDNMITVTRMLASRLDARIGSFEGETGSRSERLEVAYTDHPEAFRFYVEGIGEYDKFYFDRAADRFRRCLALDSTVAMAWYYLARIEDSRLIAKALEYYSYATPLDRHYIKAYAMLNEGNREGYRTELKALIVAYPFERGAYLQLAGEESRVGDYEAAEEHLRQLIRIDPFYRLAYNQLAYLFSRQGDAGRALAYVDEYESLVPGEANPHDTRGDILRYHGLIDSSISSYREALDINPQFTASRLKLGELLIHKGDFEAAEAVYSEPYSESLIEDQPALALGLINIPVRQGRFHDADLMLSSFISASAERVSPDVRNQLTSAYVRRALLASETQPDSAARVIKSAMDVLEPYSEPHISRLTHFYVMFVADIGGYGGVDLDSIVELYRRGVEFDRDRFTASYPFVAGCVDLSRERYATALEYLAAAAIAPTVVDSYAFRFKYGEALLMAGDPDSAVTVLEGLLFTFDQGYGEFFAWRPRTRFLLGSAYEASGRIREARDQYELILRDWKDADTSLTTLREAQERLAETADT